MPSSSPSPTTTTGASTSPRGWVSTDRSSSTRSTCGPTTSVAPQRLSVARSDRSVEALPRDESSRDDRIGARRIRRKDIMSGRALITGGAGFIGAHLSRRLLDDGWEVTLVDNLSRGVQDTALASLRERPGFALHVADLRDPSTLGSIPTDHTHVLHFAALL